jgi:hypothetical protein
MAASPELSMMKPSQSGYEMRLAGSIAVAPADLSMSAHIGRDIAKTRVAPVADLRRNLDQLQ